MRGLTIVVPTGDLTRWRVAIDLAAANLALGGATTLFVTGNAVSVLARPDALLDELIGNGLRVIVCQTSLDTAGLTPGQLAIRTEAGGPVSLIQRLGDDRLIAI